MARIAASCADARDADVVVLDEDPGDKLAACRRSQGLCPGIGDLERAVARIAASCADAVARDADAVVLYEDAAKRKVQAFVAALRGLQALQVGATPFRSEVSECAQAVR